MPGKKPFHTDLSINDIHALAWNASQGNEMSYTILKEQNRKLAKIANARMKALEKAGLKREGERRDQTGGGARTYKAWLASLGLICSIS